jgi:hypothetical protein
MSGADWDLQMEADGLAKLVALRDPHTSGGPNFTPAVAAKARNRALAEAAVALGFAPNLDTAVAAIERAITRDCERTQRCVAEMNAREGRHER